VEACEVVVEAGASAVVEAAEDAQLAEGHAVAVAEAGVDD